MILSYLLYQRWKKENPGKSFLDQFSIYDRLIYFLAALTTLALASIPLVWIDKLSSR